MLENFVLLPNTIYRLKYLDKKYHYIIWEHPHYYKSYNYNKKKLILHKATQLYYYDYLKNADYNVSYLKLNSAFKYKKYFIFDPIDKLDLPGNYTIIESKNFFLTKEDYKDYYKKTQKFVFNNFYLWAKKRLDIIPELKSTDKENRNRLAKGIEIPKRITFNSSKDYVDKAIKFVEKNFKDNYGDTKNFNLPITHMDSLKLLKNFLEKKFKLFGKYQDAIDKDNNTLFHSLLSSSINIGLLHPLEIVRAISPYQEKVDVNSYEAFIRQLFWREYQRYTYLYVDFSGNYLNLNKELTKEWYSGDLGIPPVDDSIKLAFKTGYLHHIERLMIVGNYMVLNNIKPSEVFKWFMEFSTDSYLWVMYQNVLDMVCFSTGGKTMRRPYFSSSNYVLKMSNYKKGEWSKIWDSKYYDFVENHKEKLWKYRYYFRFK